MSKRNVYKGHRYVPKIMGEWNQEETYEGLSIVTNKGTSYTSKKRVPVGIDILDEEYWVVTGNYNVQVENYRQEVREFDGRISKTESEIKNTTSQLTQKQSDMKMLNIMTDFNANGDGLADDYPIFQSAKDSGYDIFIPDGTYFMSEDFTAPKRFIGESTKGVIFEFADGKSLKLRGKDLHVENLTSNRTHIGYTWNSKFVKMDTGKTILDSESSAYGMFWNTFSLCHLRNVEVIGYGVNANTFISCRFRGTDDQPLLWAKADRDFHGNNFIGCDFSYGGGVAIQDDLGQGNSYIGCYMEGVNRDNPFVGFLGTWENGVMNDIPANGLVNHFSKVTLAQAQRGGYQFSGFDQETATNNLVTNGDARYDGRAGGALRYQQYTNSSVLTSDDDSDIPDKAFQFASGTTWRSVRFHLTPTQVKKARQVGYVSLSFYGKRLPDTPGSVYAITNGGVERRVGQLSENMDYHSFTVKVSDDAETLTILIYINTSGTTGKLILTDIVYSYGKTTGNYVHNDGVPLKSIDEPPQYIGQESIVGVNIYKATGYDSVDDWKLIG